MVSAKRRTAGRGWLATLVLAGSASIAAAQVSPDVLARIDRNVRNLDAAELTLREEATAELGDARKFNLALVQDRLFDPGLSEEPRLRLQSAGYRLFTGSVRGAMGVQFSDSTPQGVVILRTIEGFDSRIVLRPEDVIRTINGRPAVDQDNVRALIVSHDPGDEVSIGLLRNGEPLTVTLRMGRFDQLNDRRGIGPDEQSLRQAWRVRLARLAKQAEAGIAGPIDAVDIRADEEEFDFAALMERGSEPLGREFTAGLDVASLVAGGEPRGGGGWNATAFAGFRGGGFAEAPDPVVELLRELNFVQRGMMELELALNELRGAIEDPNTPAAHRQQMLVQKQVMERQLRDFEQQVRLIQQRLAQGRQPDRAVP